MIESILSFSHEQHAAWNGCGMHDGRDRSAEKAVENCDRLSENAWEQREELNAMVRPSRDGRPGSVFRSPI